MKLFGIIKLNNTLLFAMACCSLIPVGCSKQPEPQNDGISEKECIRQTTILKSQNQTRTNYRCVIDDCGRTVKVPDIPGRIVCLATADVEILFAIGASGSLAGVPDGIKYPPSASAIRRIGGMYGRFNFEKIISCNPDLVLMTISGWGQFRKHLDLLEKHNVTSLGLRYPGTFDEVISHIRRLGFITGKVTEASTLADSLEHRCNAIREKTLPLNSLQRPRVYMEWISGGNRGSTHGKNERNHEIITIAGGNNIFSAYHDIGSFTASDEEVLSRNPQIIIVTTDTTRNDAEKIRSMIRGRAGWHQIDAVKHNRIYCIDAQLTWANPRLIEGIEQCARIIQPGLFK